MKSHNIRLGIIGGGVMAEAILSRLLNQGVYPPDTILISEPLDQRRNFLHQKYQVSITADNQDAAAATEVLLLAIKPQIFEQAVSSLELTSNQTVISILAGVTLGRLEQVFTQQAVVRVMPNTPATVGAGMTAISAGSKAQAQDIERTQIIFQAIGEVVEVPESMMDAVTGLSGSGPAFVAIAIEALADGGVASGLPREIALKLAIQTVLGTAALVKDSGLHPAQLKDRVTSPGGTTIAGVAELESNGFRSALIEAVKSAYRRSQELGQS